MRHHSVEKWFNFIWRHLIVATLNNHSHDFCSVLFVARVKIPQDVRVELKDQQSVAADKPGNQPHHEQFDDVRISALPQLVEYFLAESLGIVQEINRHEISLHPNSTLPLLFPLLLLHDLHQAFFAALSHSRTFMMGKEEMGIFVR